MCYDVLIVIIILKETRRMELDSKPTINSFVFVIDGQDGQQFDAFLDLNGDYENPGGQWFVDLRYKATNSTDDKWVFLDSYDMYNVSTPEDIDAEIDAVIVKANAKIKETFGAKNDEIPESGYQRVFWTLKNGLKEVKNVISRV